MDEVAIMRLPYTKLLYKVNWLLIYLQLASLKEFYHFITTPQSKFLGIKLIREAADLYDKTTRV